MLIDVLKSMSVVLTSSVTPVVVGLAEPAPDPADDWLDARLMCC